MNHKPASNRWVDTILRPTLIAGMLACLVASVVRLLELLSGNWSGTYVVVFSFFAGLEGILSERVLQKRRITGTSYLISRGAELVVLLVLLKLASYLSRGLDQLWADARLWTISLSELINIEDFLIFAIFIPLWLGAIYAGRLVRELDVAETDEQPPPDKTSTEYYLWLTRPPPLSNRREVLARFGDLFVWGGLAMVMIPAAVYLLASLNENPLSFQPIYARSFAIPTLLYFVLGIALMSQGQFSVLFASWQLEGVSVQQGISRRWLLWAVVFVAAVGVVALLLPTGYSLGPLQALLGLLGILVDLISFLFLLFFFLLVLPLSVLLPNVERPDVPQFDPGPMLPPEGATPGPSSLETIVSVIFWVAILGVVAYALIRFWRDRVGGLSDEEALTTWWGRLLLWLRAVWRRWRTWRSRVQSRLGQRPARFRPHPESGSILSHFLFPGRMPPRELIRYFYLSTVKRAAQAGQARKSGQTPHEYQATLDERFPDLEPDLTGLTDAFVQARYGPHEMQKEDAEAVKPLWQRIKALLRRRRAQL